jgi:hypothetical protein
VRASIAERLVAVNVAAALGLVAAPALAHPEFAPQTTNRYIKLDLVAPDSVRLAYTVMVGAMPAAGARAHADANHDGRVDEAEARALGDEVSRAVAAGVTVELDGQRVTPAFEAPVVGLAGDAVGPSPFSIDLVARLPARGAGPHTLTFDDAPAEPMLGETEIRVEESPATRLITAHRGPTGNERQTRFLFNGPKFSALEDRSIALSFAAAPPAVPVKAPRSAFPLRYIVMAGIGLLLAGGIVARRLQRKMNG